MDYIYLTRKLHKNFSYVSTMSFMIVYAIKYVVTTVFATEAKRVFFFSLAEKYSKARLDNIRQYPQCPSRTRYKLNSEKYDLSRTFLFLTFCTKDHFDLPHYTYERLNDARMKEKILTEARVRINQHGRKSKAKKYCPKSLLRIMKFQH